MKINQKIHQRLENNLLQGFDLQMMQNLYLLPSYAFTEYVEEYCRENPALKIKHGRKEIYEADFSAIAKKDTLLSHLSFQIETSFSGEEKQQALEIAGGLDRDGFYDGPQTPVLMKMHYLDPVGIAAGSAREALIIQLKDQDKGRSLEYKILDQAYDFFLTRKKERLEKKFQVSSEVIERAFKAISRLTPFPGREFHSHETHHLKPELILTFTDKWHLSFTSDIYPSIGLSHAATEKQVLDAKRFIFQLNQRKNRLEWIVSRIVKKQEKFLLGEGSRSALYREEVMKGLDISESTLSRILSEKYIETPIGIFPLGYFFSKKISGISSDSSIEKARETLKEIIVREDKKKPHPDKILKELLFKQGIICSRRAVAKHRKVLSIPGVYHRAFK